MDQRRHEQFAELFVRNQATVYRYIVSIVPHRADADELFQQTSLTLWKIWDRYDSSQGFLPWTFGIARNEIRNFFRRQKLRPRSLCEDVIAELTETRLEDQEILAERQDALSGCMERLTPRQKELVDLHYGQGRPMVKIAEGRGQTAEAVYKAMQRVRESLFDCVNQTLSPGSQI